MNPPQARHYGAGLPRWVGAWFVMDSPGIYATTGARAPDGPLHVSLVVHVPRIRGALYGAWLLLTRRNV
ncbi:MULTISPECIES: hypothetical protein [Streptomyces]|uniref:Uncharacterized protein n=2 Tax=root TaxID=1 RepID=F2R692_STRVP|nr:hypothetical protein [Streptomyces venezuelae]YP_010754266.1 hypothetical protein QEH31_gp54 [Streptomyces phage Chymera]AMS01613.1 hypothetical protein SEA_CHYMERA_54 [Streptomyces phage Chymera]APE22031.1 hypothetical protein vnz_14050 [Streptomyces venezuelae]QER99420.1 hypothetical protein DEJ43_14225 [Streptomyces venezuelae ATCC 10712]CCA56143.1 hypothetical protein SVEN_2857 [Streptomyces venezuelae ATCC 10712]